MFEDNFLLGRPSDDLVPPAIPYVRIIRKKKPGEKKIQPDNQFFKIRNKSKHR